MRVALLPVLLALSVTNLAAQPLKDDEKARVEASIKEALGAAKVKVENAHKKLVEEFDKAIKKLPVRHRDLDALRKQRNAFKKTGDLPGHRRLKRARREYEKALKNAEKLRNESLLTAIAWLHKRDVDYWSKMRERVEELKKKRLAPGSRDPWAQLGKDTKWFLDTKKKKEREWVVHQSSKKKGTLVLRKPSKHVGYVFFELKIDGLNVKVVKASHSNKNLESRQHKGEGKVSRDGLELTFEFEAQIRRNRKSWRPWRNKFVLRRPKQN